MAEVGCGTPPIGFRGALAAAAQVEQAALRLPAGTPYHYKRIEHTTEQDRPAGVL